MCNCVLYVSAYEQQTANAHCLTFRANSHNMVSERGLHGLLLFGLSLFWVTALWDHQSADLSDVRETTLETIRHFIHGQGDWTHNYVFGIKRNLDLQLLHETGERKAVAVILYCTTNKCDSISERLRTMSSKKFTHGRLYALHKGTQ